MMPLRPGDPVYWPEHSCHDGCPCQHHDTEPPPDTERDIPPPSPSQQGGHVLPRGPHVWADPFFNVCLRCQRLPTLDNGHCPGEPDGWGLYHDRVHVEPGNARPARAVRVPS